MKLINANKKNSRTTNTVFNFASSVGGELISILMQFIVRTVFISTLGRSYLGINGLFSNILQMLSLAEFGVGSAIVFKLYEPIHEGDQKRIAILMRFYKTVYRLIGLFVGLVGIALIPFLPLLIKEYDKLAALNINAPLIFCLYLFKSVSSYLFFAYKGAIIKANQKEYIINLVSYFFTIGASLVQVVLLLVYPRFEIYVFIAVLQIILNNFACARIADQMYPYINEKSEEKLGRDEVKEVFKDCTALFLYKLNGVVLKATDNIVLSVFRGLGAVGLYSNYYIFYTTINSLLNKVFNSVSHSLGNLHASHEGDKEYEVFKATVLITAILGGTAGVGLFVVSDEFVHTWIGEDWVIPQPFSLLMGIEVFTLALRICISKFRTTMGLFQQAKYRPVFGMIINLIVSVALVQVWGISGVLVGTIAADWLTTMWFDPVIIHKYGYKNRYPVSKYFYSIIKYFITAFSVGLVDYWIGTHIFVGFSWFSVIFHAAVVVLTVPTVLFALVYRKPEGAYVWNLAMGYIKKVFKKSH